MLDILMFQNWCFPAITFYSSRDHICTYLRRSFYLQTETLRVQVTPLMQKDWKKKFLKGNFLSAGSDTVNIFSLIKDENEGYRSGDTGSGRAHLTTQSNLSPAVTTGAHLRRSEKRASRYDTSSSEPLTFWAFCVQGIFWASCGPCSVTSNVCLSQAFSLPWAHVSICTGAGSCVWFFWERIPGVNCPLQKPPTLFLTNLCAMFLQINNRGSLVWLVQERSVLFSTSFECFVCISKSESFCLLLCVQLKTENLPTPENCSDVLKRMWITFWKRYSKFSSEIAGGKDKICKTTMIANTPAEAEIFIYTI